MIAAGDPAPWADPVPRGDAVRGITPTEPDGSQLAERALRQAPASAPAAWPRTEPAPSVRAEPVPAGPALAAPPADTAAGIPAPREGARPAPGHPPVAIGEIHVHVAAPPAAGTDPLALLAPYALGLTARRDGAR
jgi:hypothetical protein